MTGSSPAVFSLIEKAFCSPLTSAVVETPHAQIGKDSVADAVEVVIRPVQACDERIVLIAESDRVLPDDAAVMEVGAVGDRRIVHVHVVAVLIPHGQNDIPEVSALFRRRGVDVRMNFKGKRISAVQVVEVNGDMRAARPPFARSGNTRSVYRW